MKYIIVRDHEGKEFGIVFPEALIHKTIARVHRASGLPADVCLVSAGSCELGPVVRVWGKSESLDMQSRPEDQSILQKDFGAGAAAS